MSCVDAAREHTLKSDRGAASTTGAGFEAATQAAEPRAKRHGRGPLGGVITTFLVLSLPAIWVGILIYSYGVNSPWGDQWDATRPLFEKLGDGTLRITDFFGFHNEHRIVFPRLVAFAIGLLTHWNVRAELLMIWILVCVCALNVWRLARLTIGGDGDARLRTWLLLAANVLLFSPLQWENLLWGFQIGFFLPLATTTACLWVARAVPRPFDFAATAALCLVTTFSIASGFTAWLLAAPLLLLPKANGARRHEKVCWAIWLTLAIASICVYFDDLPRPAGHPSPTAALKDPIAAFRFFLTYLGAPFSFGTAFDPMVIAQGAGAMLLLLLAGCLAYLCRWRRNLPLITRALPWVALTGIALANAALTTVGRFGFGLQAALPSRYVSFAVLLPIGLLFTVALLVQHWRAQLQPTGRLRLIIACAATCTAFALLLFASTFRSLDRWRMFQHHVLSGKAALLFVNVLDDPDAITRYVHWSHWTMKEWTAKLERGGYLNPRALQSADISAITAESSDETGAIERFVRTPAGNLGASGWAILPDAHRAADSVLLTYENENNRPIVFARVNVIAARGDVSERLRDGAYTWSGWSHEWKPEQLPEGARRITAWAFDAEKCRAFAIGSASL